MTIFTKRIMKKIAVISDTHSFIDSKIYKLINNCDEIWHAGDFGFNDDIKKFIEGHKIKGVYGNIDGNYIRKHFPKIQKFQCEEMKVLMTHIGGYPNKYKPEIEQIIKKYKPHLFISGHSHILKIMRDKQYKLLHINPGAAGKEGFHKMRTMVLLEIHGKHIKNVQVAELGPTIKSTKSIN